MKGKHVWNASSTRCKHGKRRYQGMIPLAVDKVPLPLHNKTIDSWSEVVVFVGWPGSHAADLHACRLLNSGKLTTRVGCQQRDLDAGPRETLSYLIHMRFHAAYVREVASRHQQHAQPVGLSGHRYTPLLSLHNTSR